VAAPPGRFAGKVAFGSTTGSRYLTTWSPRADSELAAALGGERKQLPAMAATSVTQGERCILYTQGDGTLRVQLGSLLWVALEESLSWLVLTVDPAQAVPVVLGGNPLGREMRVRTPDGLAPVVYTVDDPSPILTVDANDKTPDAFAPLQVTPSLDAILQSKSCRDGDLADVALSGDLSGVDFGGAVLSGATLDGVTFGPGTKLAGAKLQRAKLSRVTCDGAVLDRADLSGATLDDVAWGVPASAKEIVLTGCSARRAKLGGDRKPGLNCTGANLGTGDFTGADLRNLVLTNAQAGGAILSGAKLDGAQLDGATLTGAVAVGASLREASLVGVKAQGASLARADLSSADLTRAELGANAYLFSLAGTLAENLDTHDYPQPDLIKAFKEKGVTLPAAAVTAIQKGRRWKIADYVLAVNAAGSIDVFRTGQAPATLTGAVCQGTKAPGAGLAGADLRGVQWYTKQATLDHADLGGAVLAGSLLTGTDFAQAYLSGADLSGCVLIQTRFARCVVGPGANGQPFSLERSLLQGADFSDSTLQAALLVDAGVATPNGTPLFALPLSAQQSLTPQGLATLAPAFAKKGYPLGKSPTVTSVKTWFLDNSADKNSAAPRRYRVQTVANQLRVFDATSAKYLQFSLPPANERYLSSATAPPELVTAFNQAGRPTNTLAAAAPIAAEAYWEVKAGSDAPQVKEASYPTMRIYAEPYAEPQRLQVYGCVTALLRDWQQYPNGLAFSATQGLDRALDAGSLGPSAYPRSLVTQGALDWTTFLTPDVEP
jgi:uncharacterized protein YjbI with pentapeptide repeats